MKCNCCGYDKTTLGAERKIFNFLENGEVKATFCKKCYDAGIKQKLGYYVNTLQKYEMVEV